MTSQPAVAPEFEVAIEAAVAELDRSVMEAGLNDDPLRHPLAALALFLRAQRQLYVDDKAAREQQIAASRRPIGDEDMRRLTRAAANGAERRAAELARAANWRTQLLGGIAALVLIGGAFGAGWYWRATPAQAAVTNCVRAPQPAGGEAYSCLFWTRLPAGSSGRH